MAGTGRADFAGLSSLSLLEGSAPSGEAQVREREQGIRTKTSVGWADAETPRGGRITVLAVGIGCFF